MRVALGLLASLVLAASASAERLPLKSYTTADGLPHNQINRIVRDSRGFLWFCTGDGLSRFDGYSFTNFGTAQGLPHRRVNDLLETRDGRLWVATEAGLVRFNPAGTPDARVSYQGTDTAAHPMFTVIVAEDTEPRARVINALAEDRTGTIWSGTANGLYRLDQRAGRFVLREVDIGMPRMFPEQADVSRVLVDRGGSIWIAAPSGLYHRMPDGTSRRYTERDGLPNAYIHDLLEDHEGRLWVGTLQGGFFRFLADGSDRPVADPQYSVREGLPHNWIAQMFETHDHRFFIASPRGLVEFLPDPDEHGRRFRVYDSTQGLSASDLSALTEDAGGNLWLGSSTLGAMKLTRSGFISYGKLDGLISARAIFEDQTGRLCFRSVVVTGSSVVFRTESREFLNAGPQAVRFGRLDGGRFTSFVPAVVPSGPMLGWVTEGVTLQTRNGEWWLGMVGIYRFSPAANFAHIQSARPLAYYATKDGLAYQTFRLFEDSRGRIWASTTSPTMSGLARWDRTTGAWRDLANAAGLPPVARDLAHSFAEDRTGQVWIGFESGRVVREERGGFRLFTEADGVPPGTIANMHLDASGRLWLASGRSGLIRVDDPGADRPRFVSYSTAQGLSSDSAEVITEDRYGRIYVGTGRGLDRLDPATGRVRHFTTADGLAPGVFCAAYRDHTGVLWFGTSGGLSRLDPVPDPPALPPTILVSSLVVAGSRRLTSALGEPTIALPDLQPGQNSLQIEYVGLDFAPGATLRYQFKLEAADADWSAPTLQRSVNYGNLAPGRYRFLVRAVSDDDAVSPTPAAVAFTILRPVWQRWWFVSMVVLAVGLAGRAAIRYRLARILELANVRARIALDLHDDIGSNLTKISILSEVAQQNAGAAVTTDGPLSSIARISRESVAAMSDIVWAVNPQHDRLLDLVRRMRQHAEDVFTSRGIGLTFRAPAEDYDIRLGVDVRRDIFLIFKEALNNAARHSRCSNVDVEFKADRSWLSLQVGDDGTGFDATAAHEGQGLVGMRLRAESLGGHCEVRTAPGTGTTVRVTMSATGARKSGAPA